MSDISIENPALGGLPTDNTMMHEVKASSLSSEGVKNTLGNLFLLTMGTGTGNEVDT